MGTWNYRVVDRSKEIGEPCFQICEVYYNDKGQPTGFADACVMGASVGHIQCDLDRMLEAIYRPVVEFDNNDAGPREGTESNRIAG